MKEVNLLGQLLTIISLLPDEEPYNTFAKDVLQSLSVLCHKLVVEEESQCKATMKTNECSICNNDDRFMKKVKQFIDEVKAELEMS